jgi:hypothetical protein
MNLNEEEFRQHEINEDEDDVKFMDSIKDKQSRLMVNPDSLEI